MIGIGIIASLTKKPHGCKHSVSTQTISLAFHSQIICETLTFTGLFQDLLSTTKPDLVC